MPLREHAARRRRTRHPEARLRRGHRRLRGSLPAEAESSIALSRVLATIFGYPEGVKVAHYCEEHGVTVKEAVLVSTRRLIDPILMTDPEAMARAIAEFRARIDG